MEQPPSQNNKEAIDYYSEIQRATILDYEDFTKKKDEMINSLTERIIGDLFDPQKQEVAKQGLRELVKKLYSI